MTMENGFARDPAAFNAKAYSLDNDRRHSTAPEYLSVTAQSHPVLFATFEAISHDSGGSAGHESYSVPRDLHKRAIRAEDVLSRLTAEELETVAIGEQGEADEILANRCRDVGERHDVQGFLDAFFEDWEPFQ